MIIVVRGLMGSGKTYLSKLLKYQFDFEVINADQIVADLYENDSLIISKINQEFGLVGEKVNKKDLLDLIREKPERLKKIEGIINNRVREEIVNLIDTYKPKDIIIECQNIDDLNLEFDYEILAYATKKAIIERIKNRDNRSVKEIELFLQKQEKKQLKIQKHKQFTINTEVEEEELKENLEKIMEIINADYDWKNS